MDGELRFDECALRRRSCRVWSDDFGRNRNDLRLIGKRDTSGVWVPEGRGLLGCRDGSLGLEGGYAGQGVGKGRHVENRAA